MDSHILGLLDQKAGDQEEEEMERRHDSASKPPLCGTEEAESDFPSLGLGSRCVNTGLRESRSVWGFVFTFMKVKCVD